ncbi:MAG TPA: TIM barrel protein, partial [Candidatus Saccharicenans sp.]|nr:TIM barrel protein [Candidatus Saccharicenans sp.]
KKIFVFCLILGLSLPAGFSQTPPEEKVIPDSIKKAVKETNYNEIRIKSFPIAMQGWTYRRYTFFEALDRTKALGLSYIQAYPGQRISKELPASLVFNHQLTDEQIVMIKGKLKEVGLQIVAYGVVDTGRTESQMRQVFDFARKMGIRTIVTEPQDEDYVVLEKLVKEYNIQIAIHNHPEPAKYAYPLTVLKRLNNLDSRIGVCADTGHWMRCGLDPVECLRLLEDRVIDVHIKDRSDFGTKGAEDVAFGSGKAGIKDILAELTRQDYDGYLTIEYENEKNVLNPEPDLKKGLAFIKSVTYYDGYEQLLKRENGWYEKHGWNHYGPGFFELDNKTGILKSQGGMGLLWYSRKKFKDFILEVDYKCSDRETNSGIFLRVPDMPTSDDYIYHSFEIQIYDAGQGIHQTGAVYDAQAPSA